MTSFEVRPFRRSDRDQLTELINAHVAAVVPGVTVSVNVVLSQLEREPGEFIVDPWVQERITLVAEQRSRLVAAVHLHRYADEPWVGEAYRDTAEIRWFVFWPHGGGTYRPDATEAADALLAAALVQLDRWNVREHAADGALPAPGVYGVPDPWPHVGAALERAGFVWDGHVEIVYLASIQDLPRRRRPPIEGLVLERSVGVNGTRLSARIGDEHVGLIEVAGFSDAGRLPRHGGLGDIGNLHVSEGYRRRGVATWLVAEGARWLGLSGVDRVLEYAWPRESELIAFLDAVGFAELTRTRRGWTRRREP